MTDKIKGCLFGMAYGDALGAKTEFLDMKTILESYPTGLEFPNEIPVLVTDDSQMALSLGEALLKAEKPYKADSLGKAIETEFIAWYHSSDNNRAPGMTCLTSIENLVKGKLWHEATSISSKGCGANMRVQPVAVLNIDSQTRAALSQFQAAITHAHPTALVAADITAWTIADLINGGDVSQLAERAYDYALSQRRVYHQAWLGDIWQRALMFSSGEDYIEHGWNEFLETMQKLLNVLPAIDDNNDPCLTTGAGWVADEAYVTALYCFLLYPDNPNAVINRAARSSGDSDSLACIAGSFAGAYQGFSKWDAEWENRIEYGERLSHLAAELPKI